MPQTRPRRLIESKSRELSAHLRPRSRALAQLPHVNTSAWSDSSSIEARISNAEGAWRHVWITPRQP
eukprot:7582378-Alexandrium_andersonii.AAC.1